MSTSHSVLLVNLVATLFLVGLIWMVQIVHYPLFDDVDEQSYVSYQQRHQSSITYIVGPTNDADRIGDGIHVTVVSRGRRQQVAGLLRHRLSCFDLAIDGSDPSSLS